MVRDWLTGGRLTLLVSPARYVPYTRRPAYSTEQEGGNIIYHGKFNSMKLDRNIISDIMVWCSLIWNLYFPWEHLNQLPTSIVVQGTDLVDILKAVIFQLQNLSSALQCSLNNPMMHSEKKQNMEHQCSLSSLIGNDVIFSKGSQLKKWQDDLSSKLTYLAIFSLQKCVWLTIRFILKYFKCSGCYNDSWGMSPEMEL